MRFTSPTQVPESSSVTARSLSLGFSIAYSTRSRSGNLRCVCCWREVISIRRRTKWGETASFQCRRVQFDNYRMFAIE
jgi:hypothetical protein